jgi:hypothetical protein
MERDRLLDRTKAEQYGNRTSPSDQGAGLWILGDHLPGWALRRVDLHHPAKGKTGSLEELLDLR